MPYRPIVFLFALFLAVGLPALIFVVSARAKASLKRLLAERFSPRPFPIHDVVVPSGGSVRLYAAYDDIQGSGFVLVLGLWGRGNVRVGAGMTYVSNDVAGLFKAGDPAWLKRLRNDRRLIVKAVVEGGAVAVWKGLPSRRSVLAHLESVASLETTVPSHMGHEVTPASQIAESVGPEQSTRARGTE